MKAEEVKLLEFIKKPNQFTIPIYQRTYSWTERECRQLWNDILQAGKDDKIPAHFVGSVVYINKCLYQVSNHPPLLVIDGQQRLTTVSLIITALIRHLGDAEPLEGFSVEKLKKYYLINPSEKGERRHKLLLTQTDKESLLSLIEEKPWPANGSIRIKENFEFFEREIKNLEDIKSLCKGLAKLIIVDISLDAQNDRPQVIFESMNSTGKELSQADLIRNFILMGLEQKQQEELYENHWHPMEAAFGQKAYSKYFDDFMRDYLTIKTGKIPNLRKVYESFKEYIHKMNVNVGALVADIHTFADYYCAIALGKEKNEKLKQAFSDLRELKVNVSYPFLLQVYNDYKKDLLSLEDFEKIVRLVESYVFRRAICNIPTNSLNKTFAAFAASRRKKDCYVESVKAQLLLQPARSYRRFPRDEEFFRAIQKCDLYNFRNRSYWLKKIENYDRKEEVNINEYTVEHILPQNENLSLKWQKALGSEWKKVQERYLHTIGNLTLTGYNSEYRDKPFIEKRDMEKGGFKDSPLWLNKGLREIETWNEDAIKKRAKQMAEKAKKVWSAPVLSEDVLNIYRPKKQQEEPSSYSIKDYSHLSHEPIKSLFEAFQKAVLDLNPDVVTEEFRKRYIAYKAESNVVCVEPQAKRLRLSLNVSIHELNDPKGIAKDISSVGRWGTGDVEVGLQSKEDLPYVMGLIRQALEKQIGGNHNDEEEEDMKIAG